MFLYQLRKSIKPLLWIVVIGFGVSLFFTYTRLSSRQSTSTLLKVNGEEITYSDFIRSYYDVYTRYTESTGEKISPDMENYLKTQVLSQLLTNALLYQEAKKAKIKVSDEEIKRQVGLILSQFGSRENFMRYLQSRGMDYPQFEDLIHRQIAVAKLTQLITSSITLTEKELRDYWMIENETLTLSCLFLSPDKYASDIKVEEEEAKKYYEENKEEFRVPEKVSVEYILVSPDEFEGEVKVTEEEMKEYYNEHLEEFEVEEERRASHILVKLSPDAPTDERLKAEEKIEKIKKLLEEKKDFAELAREYSDDRASAERGGDLGWFTYDMMTPEFSKAVFSLKEVGEVSGVVESPYGLHLIRLTGIKPAHRKSFDEVREEIRKFLIQQKKEKLAQEEVDKVKREIEKGRLSFEEYAKTYPERVKSTSFFSFYEKPDNLSFNLEFNRLAFSLEPGKISSPIRIKEGLCIMTLKEKKPSYIPSWEEVKEKAKKEVARQKAEKITEERAREIVKKIREEKAPLSLFAEEWDFETFDSVTRGSWIKGIYGTDRDKFLKVAFSLPAGKVSDPLSLSDRFCIIEVKERKIPMEKFDQEKEELYSTLLERKKEEFLSAWFTQIKQEAKIIDNTSLLFASSSSQS
ncbi:peptidyl-prolyl cis-trans isomerase [Candidatus Aerophobetes bacterium]|nr:peptidyl-prolyl cis-trans isomerase [Candidatus Aerophobetes bacterium]